ncbi:MAG: hypothetical protein WAN81_05900, partial [Candidatus Binataceae bacterium]
MTPSNDIEDRFASAVKSALDASKEVTQPTEAAAASVQAGGHPRRRRAWGIALLCVALAAIAAVAVAAALRVRRGDVARLAAEIAAMRPGDASNQPSATAVAPGAVA